LPNGDIQRNGPLLEAFGVADRCCIPVRWKTTLGGHGRMASLDKKDCNIGRRDVLSSLTSAPLGNRSLCATHWATSARTPEPCTQNHPTILIRRFCVLAGASSSAAMPCRSAEILRRVGQRPLAAYSRGPWHSVDYLGNGFALRHFVLVMVKGMHPAYWTRDTFLAPFAHSVLSPLVHPAL
jgi:hypothetical protein